MKKKKKQPYTILIPPPSNFSAGNMHAWKVGNVSRPLSQNQILTSVRDPFVRLPDGEE